MTQLAMQDLQFKRWTLLLSVLIAVTTLSLLIVAMAWPGWTHFLVLIAGVVSAAWIWKSTLPPDPPEHWLAQ